MDQNGGRQLTRSRIEPGQAHVPLLKLFNCMYLYVYRHPDLYLAVAPPAPPPPTTLFAPWKISSSLHFEIFQAAAVPAVATRRGRGTDYKYKYINTFLIRINIHIYIYTPFILTSGSKQTHAPPCTPQYQCRRSAATPPKHPNSNVGAKTRSRYPVLKFVGNFDHEKMNTNVCPPKAGILCRKSSNATQRKQQQKS